MKGVAVTGVGVVGPVGHDARAFFAALAAGRSGIARLSMRNEERLVCRVGAAVKDFDAAARFPGPQLRMLDRVSQFALVAAGEALRESGDVVEGLDRDRAGVFLGTGAGGAGATDEGYHTLYAEGSDRVKPFTVLQAMANAPASWLAIEHGLRGANLTYSTACSSSAVAIGEAARRVASGELDVALAGGSEACLDFGTLKAWDAMRTLATEDGDDPSASCKPFSRDRSGLVLGEGAAVLVLENLDRARARGARVLAEIAGYGLCTDAAHITRPTVEGQADAMRRALRDAEMSPADIGYINAHGTATQANDAVETAAIRAVFGAGADAIPVSSTKSMHGHLLGAAGAVELVVAILAMEAGLVPPTQHLVRPDPACDLDYVPITARRVSGIGAVMSNSFAFGGTNAVLIARRTG